MKTTWNRALVSVGVAALLVAPSAAFASGGQDASQGVDDQGGAATQEQHDSGQSGGGTLNRTERYELRGAVTAVDPSAQTVTVSIAKANHGRRGRAFVGQTITFDVSSARIDVKDTNGDGARDLGDVAVGDSIEVRAELPRSGSVDLTNPVAAQRLKDRTRHHANESAGQQPEDPTNHG